MRGKITGDIFRPDGINLIASLCDAEALGADENEAIYKHVCPWTDIGLTSKVVRPIVGLRLARLLNMVLTPERSRYREPALTGLTEWGRRYFHIISGSAATKVGMLCAMGGSSKAVPNKKHFQHPAEFITAGRLFYKGCSLLNKGPVWQAPPRTEAESRLAAY